MILPDNILHRVAGSTNQAEEITHSRRQELEALTEVSTLEEEDIQDYRDGIHREEV